jgi:hypothetical protein
MRNAILTTLLFLFFTSLGLANIPELNLDLNSQKYEFKIDFKGEAKTTIPPVEKGKSAINVNQKSYVLTVTPKQNKSLLKKAASAFNALKRNNQFYIHLQDLDNDGSFDSINIEKFFKGSLTPKRPDLFATGIINKEKVIDLLLVNEADIEVFSPQVFKILEQLNQKGKKETEKKKPTKKLSAKESFLRSMENPGYLLKIKNKVFHPDFLPDWITATTLGSKSTNLEALIDLLLKSVPIHAKINPETGKIRKVVNLLSLRATIISIFRKKIQTTAKEIGLVNKQLLSGKDPDGNNLTDAQRQELYKKSQELTAQIQVSYAEFQRSSKLATATDIMQYAMAMFLSYDFVDDVRTNPEKFKKAIDLKSPDFLRNLKRMDLFQLPTLIKATRILIRDTGKIAFSALADLLNPRNAINLWNKGVKAFKDPGFQKIYMMNLVFDNLALFMSQLSMSGSMENLLTKDLGRFVSDLFLVNSLGLIFFGQMRIADENPISNRFWRQYLGRLKYCIIVSTPIDGAVNYVRFKKQKGEPLSQVTREDLDYLMLRARNKISYNAAFYYSWSTLFYGKYLENFKATTFNQGFWETFLKGAKIPGDKAAQIAQNMSRMNIPFLSNNLKIITAGFADWLNKFGMGFAEVSVREKILKAKSDYTKIEKKGDEAEDSADVEAMPMNTPEKSLDDLIQTLSDNPDFDKSKIKDELDIMFMTSKNPEELTEKLREYILPQD